jgi:four helix bundle protein
MDTGAPRIADRSGYGAATVARRRETSNVERRTSNVEKNSKQVKTNKRSEPGTQNMRTRLIPPRRRNCNISRANGPILLQIQRLFRRFTTCTSKGMQKSWDLSARTMEFAVDGFRFCRTVRPTDESRDIIRQLRRALSAVASNYRATKRAQSDPAFVAKLAVVVEEADEAGFWLDFLVQLEIVKRPVVAALVKESSELVAIFTKSKKTVEARIEGEKEAQREKRRTTKVERRKNAQIKAPSNDPIL